MEFLTDFRFLPSVVGALLLAAAAVRRVALDRHQGAREAAAGVEVLRALGWKDLVQTLARSFEVQGFSASAPRRQAGEEGPDLLLTRGAERVLLQLKHGGTYRVGAGLVQSLASMLPLHQAQSAVLATTGRIDAAALRAAQELPIELLGGTDLWQTVRALLPEPLARQAGERAKELGRKARSKLAIAAVAGAGLVLLGAGFWLLDRLEQRHALDQPTTTSVVTKPARRQQPVVAPSSSDAPPAVLTPSPVTAPPESTAPAAIDPAQQRARAVADSLTLPGVASATWSSDSTLSITLSATVDEPRRGAILEEICRRVVALEALGYTRLEVHTLGATGPEALPRWFACP